MHSSWSVPLRRALKAHQQNNSSLRLAILGIGQPLRGDDAVALSVIDTLSTILPPRDNLLLLNTGVAPENCTSTLRRFAPHIVLLLDAAHQNLSPGTIFSVDLNRVTGISASTHTMPLTLLAQYFTNQLHCRVFLIGLQPAQNDWNTPLSPALQRAASLLTQHLADLVQSIT